jgi:hypothetical protein
VSAGHRLFHFSDDPSIEVFEPRPVDVPARRDTGMEWLNGPLVWAVSEERQAAYMFPRDCPRILLWPTERTVREDVAAWLGTSSSSMIAYIEALWLDRVRAESIHRDELPAGSFERLPGEADGWMWVSRSAVTPLRRDTLTDLPAALAAAGVELRVMDTLAPLRDVWSTSLHVSGIRLRNARGWPPK